MPKRVDAWSIVDGRLSGTVIRMDDGTFMSRCHACEMQSTTAEEAKSPYDITTQQHNINVARRQPGGL